MTQSLGYILRDTEFALHVSDHNTQSYQRDLADDAAILWRMVKKFFDHAKVDIETDIRNRVPPNLIGVPLGKVGRDGPEHHRWLFDLFKLDRIDPNASIWPFGDALSPPWHEFQKWANANQMNAVWLRQENLDRSFYYVLTVRANGLSLD